MKNALVPELVPDPNSWPQDISHEPNLKIGEVLHLLHTEFPYLAASKLRYFESQNLVVPGRTASNQRLYSLADVERVRFILTEQRDRFVSLPQIAEMLRQLDSGMVKQAHPGKMRVLADDEVVKPQPGTRLRKDELASLLGVSVADIERYVNEGLLVTDARGRLTVHAIEIVRYARMLEEKGLHIRKVRSVRNSAHQHAVNALQLLAADLQKNTPIARERVVADTAEYATMLSNIYAALVLESFDVELR